MLKIVAFLVVILSAVAYCEDSHGGSKESSNLIVGGTNAGRRRFPEFAIIYFDGNLGCGGTIVNERSILTAAHCVNAGLQNYQVAVGKYRLDKDQGTEQYFTVSEIFRHFGSSSSNPANDIAIVRIDGQIVYDEYVQPVNLVKGPKYENYIDCYVVGAGVSNQDIVSEYPRVLQRLTTRVVGRKRCKKLNAEHGKASAKINNKVLCTYDKGTGICYGDSGGPLGCYTADGTFEQYGIHAYGNIICEVGFNVFTRISQYRTWIQETA